ncbi:transposase [Streptomyces sp. NBC_00233]|uniref:transposase n=1 Tax=Streptomyces sp. NBC_00233 TaxID=2975686 RepID=UPI00338EDD99
METSVPPGHLSSDLQDPLSECPHAGSHLSEAALRGPGTEGVQLLQVAVGRETRAARRRDDQRRAVQIREVHSESGGAFGSPRVTAEPRENGLRVNEKRIARVTRIFSITGIRLRRRVRTTVCRPGRRAGPGPVPAGLHRTRTRPQNLSRDGAGLLQPQGRRLVHR